MGARDHAKDAAKALSDLNMFTAIQVLCESSLISADAFSDEERINKVCRAAIQRCLRRYDRALAKVTP